MRIRNPLTKQLFIFCILALTVIGSRSQDISTATVIDIRGTVQISRPNQMSRVLIPIKFGVNDTVLNGDLIKTGANGRLVLKLKDNSLVVISNNTTVEVKDTSESPRTIMYVLKGKTRVKIEKLGGKPNPYRVTTPTTVVAVRGTIFDVIVEESSTEVFVNEGEVSVINLFAPNREVLIQPGNFTHVKGENAPPAPAPFSPNKNDKFFDSENIGGLGNIIPNNRRGRGNGNTADKNRPPDNPSKPPANSGNPTQGPAPPPRKP